MLLNLKDQAELVVSINADDIEKSKVRGDLGISYDADMKKAKQIVEDMLRSDPSVIQDEEIMVFVSDLADSAVIIGLRAWVKTEEYWATRWRLLEQIKTAFDEAQIEIPYNQLTVHMAGTSENSGQMH